MATKPTKKASKGRHKVYTLPRNPKAKTAKPKSVAKAAVKAGPHKSSIRTKAKTRKRLGARPVAANDVVSQFAANPANWWETLAAANTGW